jgi:hypothetical protein
MTCATVSVVWGLKWDDLRVFAHSLSRSGYKGEKIMFVSDFAKYPGPNSSAVFEDARMPVSDLQELTLSLKKLGFTVVSWTPDVTKRPATDRHRPVLEYFRVNPVPDWLIFTDTRDVVIQSDPQAWLEANGHDLVGAGEGVVIAGQEDNYRWVVEAVGKTEADAIWNQEICCHGTLIGKGPLLLKYMKQLYGFLLVHPNKSLIDQGAGNWMLRQSPFKEKLFVTHRDGLVGTYVWDVTLDAKKNLKVGISVRDGVIYPSEQSEDPVPICHFWFTLPEAKEIRARHWE